MKFYNWFKSSAF